MKPHPTSLDPSHGTSTGMQLNVLSLNKCNFHNFEQSIYNKEKLIKDLRN